MDKDFIRLNSEACIRCGFCIDDCPTCVLEMGEAGPQVFSDPG